MARGGCAAMRTRMEERAGVFRWIAEHALRRDLNMCARMHHHVLRAAAHARCELPQEEVRPQQPGLLLFPLSPPLFLLLFPHSPLFPCSVLFAPSCASPSSLFILFPSSPLPSP
eukprot:2546502-Rhodomonas_salina.1